MRKTAAATGDDPEAIKRKKRSERILVIEGVPIKTALPLIQVPADSQPRSKEEVAMRTLCLLMVAMKAERMDQTMVLRTVRQYDLAAFFTPIEKEFIRNATPTDDEKMALSARYEAAWALLWALGYIDALSTPNQMCDVDRAIACMRDRDTSQLFIDDARLRPLAQLLDQADLTFRYRWAMSYAERKQRDIPAGLKTIVVNERLTALSWLIRYSNKEWDEIEVSG